MDESSPSGRFHEHHPQQTTTEFPAQTYRLSFSFVQIQADEIQMTNHIVQHLLRNQYYLLFYKVSGCKFVSFYLFRH